MANATHGHFLNKLNNIGQLPDGVLLVILDVSSLYTNIPHKDGIQTCSEFLESRLNSSDNQTLWSHPYAWSSHITLSLSTDNTTDKSLEQRSARTWLPLTPISSWGSWRTRPSRCNPLPPYLTCSLRRSDSRPRRSLGSELNCTRRKRGRQGGGGRTRERL